MELALHKFWEKQGARFGSFAGFTLPLQFASPLKEHLAVREAAGLFDVSHMGTVTIQGGEVQQKAGRLFPSKLEKKKPGQALYTLLLNEEGKILDDLIVGVLSPHSLFAIVNAARKVSDVEWIKRQLSPAEVQLDGKACLLALQGPKAPELLARVLQVDLSSLYYMEFRKGRVGKWDLLISRTGYTGSDGFELVVGDNSAEDVATALLEAGAVPCGLAARDSLRLEAGYRLYGQDMDETTSPLAAGLEFVIHWEKEFLGKEALLKERAAGVSKKLRGVLLEEPGIPRRGAPVLAEGVSVGELSSGGYSPLLKKGIGLASLPLDVQGSVEVLVHGKGRKGKVLDPPFVSTNLYRRSRSP